MSNLPLGAEHDPRAPYNQVDYGEKECTECSGIGYYIYSCCGDDMTQIYDDLKRCITCKENLGELDDIKENCDECDGEGIVPRTEEDELNDYESYQESLSDEQRENPY